MRKLELAPGSRTDHPNWGIDRSHRGSQSVIHARTGGSTSGWRPGPAHREKPRLRGSEIVARFRNAAPSGRPASTGIAAVVSLAACLLLGVTGCSESVTAEKLGDGGSSRSSATASGETNTTRNTTLASSASVTTSAVTNTDSVSPTSTSSTILSSGTRTSTNTSAMSASNHTSHASTTTTPSASTSSGFNPGQGDLGSECAPPDGGLPCTPGFLACGSDLSCSLPGSSCCQVGAVQTCQPATAPCANAVLFACNEAADCTAGQACCLAANDEEWAVSCETLVGGKCPSAAEGSAQICRSSNECAAGDCRSFTCDATIVQACSNPIPVLGGYSYCVPNTADAG
jgi:hypothetical protein